MGLSFPLALVPVGLAAAIGAWLGCKLHGRDWQNASTAVPATTTVPDVAQLAPVTSSTLSPPVADQDPKLRHDIRGIISPAMLAAEQLDENPDPLVQKAAQTINESLDRLLIRLKQQPPV
ncbi:hypothetical protein [Acetobacter indonesiensis]